MSRRRSAFATIVVVSVFVWCYILALAIPVRTGDVSALWAARGHDWFGDVLARLANGLSFLWGSSVSYDGSIVTPPNPWATLVFVLLLAGLVYANLRHGADGAYAVAGRVLCACLLAGGLTNLFVAVSTVLGLAGDRPSSVPGYIGSPPADGIWLGVLVGLLGAYAVAAAALVLAVVALGRPSGTEDPAASPRAAAAPTGATGVATWGVLPMIALALAGGFLWDYGPDVYTGAEVGSREAWVRLVWFAHASLSAPDDPFALGNAFDTSVWLPRTLSSAVLVVLVWLAVRLMVARWQRGGAPGVLGVVVQCWGVVAVLAVVVGMVEGVLVPVPAPELDVAAHVRALNNVADALRFAACFGWITGVVVALAHRLSGRPTVSADSAGPILERSAD